MNAVEIADLLKDAASWNAASSHQRGAFVVEMKDRSYGWDALTQAWAWFLAGWNTRDAWE